MAQAETFALDAVVWYTSGFLLAYMILVAGDPGTDRFHGGGDRGAVSASTALAAGILVVSLVAVALGVYNAHVDRQRAAYDAARADCQTDINRQFLDTLKHNTELTTQDRENLDETITRLVEADPAEDNRDILRDYLEAREQSDEERENYPPLPDEVCDV